MNIKYKITQEQIEQYQNEGYFVLENIISEDQLKEIRAECDYLVKEQEAQMDKEKIDVLGLSKRNSRYFIFNAYKYRPYLEKFIFSEPMAEICKSTIGNNAYLFWEQFVVKGTDKKGAEFTWHQDSGYVDGPHKYYVNCWIPLDDVNEENGTIYILPYSIAGTKEKVEHKQIPNSSDRQGYFGPEKGIPMNVKAGSIVVFSSVTFHRSGANYTDKMRRVWSLQYSPEIIYEPDGSLKGLDVLFLKDGEIVKNELNKV
ncbi:phytanoyl-CoA dioxygenase family protein [Ignavibacteria bacterium 4148-Me]|uniref:phytanoyl-CoA dioxygenase family protein n=1 Tax=Rosettibacter primus TaxID=3111523 RepID=UPI00336C070F